MASIAPPSTPPNAHVDKINPLLTQINTEKLNKIRAKGIEKFRVVVAQLRNALSKYL